MALRHGLISEATAQQTRRHRRPSVVTTPIRASPRPPARPSSSTAAQA